MFSNFISEFIGTAALVLFINGAIAAHMLRKGGASGGGWLQVILSVGAGVFVANAISAHSGSNLNPAVSIALAVDGKLSWSEFPVYIVGQLAGGMAGALVAYAVYKKLFDANTDNENLVMIFATEPAVRSYFWNCVSEGVGTFMLILWVLAKPSAISMGNAGLGYAAVGLVIVAIGGCLGSPTNWAINPARDVGPRLIYSLLPIKDKGSADWAYSWVPVVAPMLGALAAVPVARLL